MIKQNLNELSIEFKARIDHDLFQDLFNQRLQEEYKIPRGLEANFLNAKSGIELNIKKSIESFRAAQIEKFEEEISKQTKRLQEANEKLKIKETKTALKEKDISARQIERFKNRLEKLNLTKELPGDSRIYAMDYAPVIVMRNKQRVIVPMRYHLRPGHVGEDFDYKYPGCYNARRDSLTGFWKNQFGKKHAVLIVTSFFENVAKHDFEKRKLKKGEKEENLVIEFKPKGLDYMIVPCIWDEWKGKLNLTSFALITDAPPPEVLETGHDRCPIFLKESRIDDWLNPTEKSAKELFEILDDRENPFYESRSTKISAA